jgi:DNA-binding GntR family transcriptional regulator
MAWTGEPNHENMASESLAVVRIPLPAQILSRLRAEIVSGHWTPGQRLSENTLCTRFSVSRTPLRQAFKVLEAEGLITLTPNHGAVVSEPTLDGVDEKLMVLATLEALACELVCEQASDEELQSLKTLHEEMMQAYADHDVDNYYRLNDQIHRGIVEASGNQTLADFRGILVNHLERVRNLANIRVDLSEISKHEHEDIMEALMARHRTAAGQRMATHIDSIRRKIRSVLQ